MHTATKCNFICIRQLSDTSFAYGDPFVIVTRLALHVTAPIELAVTALRTLHLQRVVAPPTTQGLAIVQPIASLITQSAGSSRRVVSSARFAEVRRFLVVEEIGLAWTTTISFEQRAVCIVGHVDLKIELKRVKEMLVKKKHLMSEETENND